MSKDLVQIADTIIKDQGRMELVRQPRESRTKRIFRLFRPTRVDLDDNKQEGKVRQEKVYFDTPAKSLFQWANAYVSATTSKRGNWFDFEFSVEEINNLDSAQLYLQASKKQMRNAFERTNFYDEVIPMVEDVGADGNGYMEPIHDLEVDEAWFQTQEPGDVWISRDKYGKVNRVHIRHKISAEAAYDMFEDSEYQGQELKGNLPDALIKNATESTGDPLAEYEFIHARWKNPDRRLESLLSEDKEFLNCWVSINGKDQSVVELNGVDTLSLEWTPGRSSRNVYGTGLADHALTSAEIGDAYAKKKLQMTAIAVEGRFKASKGVRGKFDRRPGGTTYLNEGEDIEMFGEKTNARIADIQMDEFKQEVREWFWLDLLLAVSSIENPKDVTAFYVSQLQGEKAQILTSTTTAYEHFLDKVMEFVWNIETGAGRMPAPPAELQAAIDQWNADNPSEAEGVTIKPNYTGPLFQLQREALEVSPILKGLDGMERINLLFPESLVKIDGDKLTEEYLDALQFPEKIQRTDSEVDEIRAAEAAALAEQQQREMLQTGLENTSGLDKKPEDGSILAEALTQ